MSAPASVDQAHLRVVSPADAHDVVVPPRDHVATPGFAVAMILVPPVFVLLAFTVPRLVLSPWSVVVAVVVTMALGWVDTALLRRAGVRMGLGEAVFVGAFYLLARSRRTRSGPGLAVAWLLSIAATLVALHTFAAVHSLEGPSVERRLAAWAGQHGAAHTSVSCPDHLTGRTGAVVTCSARAPGGRRGVFDVTITGSGFSWVVRPTGS